MLEEAEEWEIAVLETVGKQEIVVLGKVSK